MGTYLSKPVTDKDSEEGELHPAAVRREVWIQEGRPGVERQGAWIQEARRGEASREVDW